MSEVPLYLGQAAKKKKREEEWDKEGDSEAIIWRGGGEAIICGTRRGTVRPESWP